MLMKIDLTIFIKIILIGLRSKLFEWGGISFSDEEWYKIRMAMKKILMENDL